MRDPCIEWEGTRRPDGYGIFYVGRGADRRAVRAHRAAWETVHGPIPEGMVIAHHCDHPPCVNTEHLFLATQAENLADMDRKGRRRWPDYSGTRNPRAKLTERAVRLIRQRYAAGGVRQSDLAATFGVSRGTVGEILRGESWTCLQ